MKKTLVLQSHRQPLPYPWIEACLQSVQLWAERCGYEYQYSGNELFNMLDSELLKKTQQQKVIATDLARLKWIQQSLKAGYQTVVWLDADFLIINPDQFALPADDYAVGRENWVQYDRQGKLRVYQKVHNAFLMFRQGNSFLDFYTETAEKLLRLNNGTMPPQFIGPKLLTAMHNIAQLPVQEIAAMLSPLVIYDLLQGSGNALALFQQYQGDQLIAANLCASSCDQSDITADQMQQLINQLITTQI